MKLPRFLFLYLKLVRTRGVNAWSDPETYSADLLNGLKTGRNCHNRTEVNFCIYNFIFFQDENNQKN